MKKSKKNNCLSKTDIKELIDEYILGPLVVIGLITLAYYGARWGVKQIYMSGCFNSYYFNSDYRGPSFQQCDDLFEGVKK